MWIRRQEKKQGRDDKTTERKQDGEKKERRKHERWREDRIMVKEI